MPTAVTACIPCRQLKAKCIRPHKDQICARCDRLALSCETIPRRLGRKLGSKNRSSLSNAHESSRLSTSHASASTSVASTPGPVYDDQDDISQHDTSHHDQQHISPTAHAESSTRAKTPTNMLNVLAKAANDMPATTSPIDTRSQPFPFDRRRFLELFRQPAKTLDPDPYAGISILEQGLDQLLAGEEPSAIDFGNERIHQRIDQPRRDLSHLYDVLYSSLLSHNEVEDLLEVYWSRCNPITRILDPQIYTLGYIQASSALLLTAMLQVAAQCLPVSGHSLALVSKLDQHMEFLISEVTKFGYQSLEICQALIIYSSWLRGDKQHQTWQLVSQAMSMGVELRLDVAPGPPWSINEISRDRISSDRMKRNLQRTWMILVDQDRSRPMLRASLAQQTALSALESWWRDSDALEFDVMTCALLNMRELTAVIQRESQRILMSSELFDFDNHLQKVDSQIEAWRQTWLRRLSEVQQARISFMVRCSRFVLLMTPFEHRMSTEGIRGAARDECLVAAMEVCKAALPIFTGSHPAFPTQSVTTYNLYLVGYTAFCTLRILDSAPLAGEHPNVDVDLFHLSILAALAHQFCQLKVHPNIASISSALGKRLLHTTRKFASIRQAREAMNNAPLATNDILGFTPTQNDLNFHFPNIDTTSLDPQDLTFSFDFTHFGDLFPFLEDSNPPFPGVSFNYPQT